MAIIRVTWAAIALLAAVGVGAQEPPRPDAPPAAAPAPPARQRRAGEPTFDQDAQKRGQELLVARCGFCHGTSGRGGSTGPDLTRSALVQEDENGKQLGEFLKVGRPDRNMPAFQLTPQELTDLATYLHASIYLAANRNLYQILDILTGDAKAGAAFFQGAGKCATCHSATGDLKGIGAKYDPTTLQQRVLLPRGGGFGGPPGARGQNAYLGSTAVKATVTLASGESFTGALLRLTDFDVSIYSSELQERRSWLRSDGVPKVVVSDPLQAHVELLRKWTDKDMHDITAYLAGLK